MIIIAKLTDVFTGEPLNTACYLNVIDVTGKVIQDSIAPFSKSSFEGLIPKRKELFLQFNASGYEPNTVHIKLSNLIYKKDTPLYRVGVVEMLPKLNTNILDEVTVTATKVKMVIKGDTIEYNAAAFQLAEGSMLDNLIRALPNAELDNNGRITVNGEFVSELMVNGRDFFKGDPRVALSNLPAYTVKKYKSITKPMI